MAVYEEMYPVHKFVGGRTREGCREVRVRWKGYGEDEDTWEPEWRLKEDLCQRDFSGLMSGWFEVERFTDCRARASKRGSGMVIEVKVQWKGFEDETWVAEWELIRDLGRKTYDDFKLKWAETAYAFEEEDTDLVMFDSSPPSPGTPPGTPPTSPITSSFTMSPAPSPAPSLTFSDCSSSDWEEM